MKGEKYGDAPRFGLRSDTLRFETKRFDSKRNDSKRLVSKRQRFGSKLTYKFHLILTTTAKDKGQKADGQNGQGTRWPRDKAAEGQNSQGTKRPRDETDSPAEETGATKGTDHTRGQGGQKVQKDKNV